MIIPNGECCHRFMNRLFMWSPKFIHNGKNLVIFDITLDILKESLNLGNKNVKDFLTYIPHPNLLYPHIF